MAALFSKYRVILSGQVMPEFNRRQVLESLAQIFHSKPSTMEKLLQGNPIPLRKQYDRDQAQLICDKILNSGAQCQIEEIPEIPLQLLDEETIPYPEQLEDRIGADNPDGDPDEDAVYGSNIYRRDEDSLQDPNFGRDKLSNLVMLFVGTNLDYYRNQFRRLGSVRHPTFRMSWNWPAFFFFFFWALYRKLWIWAVVYVLGGAALMMLLPPGPISLVWLFAWPLSANYIYYRQAIANARAAMQAPEQEAQYLDKGGVSRFAVWIGLLVMIVVSVATSNYVTTRFMQEYGEYIKDTLPGSGTQIRGDGSAMGEISAANTPLSKTSLTLSYLGTSLKILLVSSKARENPDSIRQFVDQLNTDNVKDGWGQAIHIIEEPGKYLLISAGPDGAFDSEDDVIQPVIIVGASE